MAITKNSQIDLNGNEMILDADGDTSITADTDDQIDFKAAGSVRVTMDSSGNVGIGTTSPSRQLHLNNASDHGIMAITGSTSSLAGVVFGDTADDDVSSIIHNNSSNYLYLSTSSTERMRIESGGNVLLNQTATADSGVADARLEITRSSQHCLNCHVAGTGNSTLVAFINDNGFVGGINTNGSATAFNTSSDARLKNVLGDAKGLEVINALNAVNFEWKSDGKIQDGLIAQEVEKVFPDAVSEPELDGEWYSVDYSKLVTPLIKGMQEQQVIIDGLKARIETLEGSE